MEKEQKWKEDLYPYLSSQILVRKNRRRVDYFVLLKRKKKNDI